MYQNDSETMAMSQVTQFQSKVHIRWRGENERGKETLEKSKTYNWRKKTINLTQHFYFSLEISNEKAPRATRLLSHYLNQQFTFSLKTRASFEQQLVAIHQQATGLVLSISTANICLASTAEWIADLTAI